MVLLRARGVNPSANIRDGLQRLGEEAPLVRARLVDEHWVAKDAPTLEVAGDEKTATAVALRPFELSAEPPLRVITDGATLTLAGHHAAFDGLALATILDVLLGASVPRTDASPRAGTAGSRATILRRLLMPADPVAPSRERPIGPTLAAARVTVPKGGVTAHLAAAATHAGQSHNNGLGTPWRRIGVTVAMGQASSIGNFASYRRIDARADASIEAEVGKALAQVSEPAELIMPTRALKLLRPLVPRLSDSLLVSNLGLVPVAGVDSIEFFPVARGRSAVVVGAAGVSREEMTVTVRARDLTEADAEEFLAAIVAYLS